MATLYHPGKPLRLMCSTSEDINSFRISALFETEPKLDGVVGAIIRNGFRYIGDLHTARVGRVFENSNARLDERRTIIERLKRNARVRLVYQ
ncbi:MAG TPA: hypothetical protein VFR09_08935 [Alphaproteobacteria bacterium]|nr:hypothetical protein [Alphaproteobacteria bacterium]